MNWVAVIWSLTAPTARYARSRVVPGLILFLSAWIGVADAAPRRVLIVHSFGSAAPPFTTHSIAFETELTGKLGEPVDLDEISLDMARYAHPEMQEALVDYIRKRQAKWQPDLVVPIGSPAGVFVAQYRDRLFPETPVLYTGMDQRRLPEGALTNNAAFVGENFNLPGMVEDIFQVAPATTNIAVVIGASPLEQFWAAAFRKEFEPFTNRVGFTWLNDLSFDELLGRVSQLPPHSYIFFILLLRDATGVTHNADEAIKQIHAVANAPMNSIFQHQMGLGIVGGRLYQAELEGVESARIAIRILHGEPASAFPPKVVGPLPPQYDWRELKRWGISEASLPAGSSIRFRQPGFWELYWWWIAGTAAFCLLQTALTIGLLVNRARRRQEEAVAALVADISSKFVNLLPDAVDREIVDSQRRIFEVLGLDVSGFWQWSAEASGFFRITHFSRPGEEPQLPEQMNSQEYLPWFQEQVLAGRTVAVSSMDELPAEAVRDRETFRQFGFKSKLTIPISVGGGPPIGALGFTTRVEREWPAMLVKRLQLLAQIFASALARKRAELELAQQRSELTHLSRVTTMGELSSSLAHELNQPLAIILTNAQAAQRLLVQQPPDVAEAREILADIVSEDQRAGEVIRRLRTFLKPGQTRLVPLSMNDLVEDVFRIARSDLIGRSITVHTALPRNLPPVLGDRIQLQQVLLNLILNAGDAMASNPPARRQLTLATAHRNDLVRISVSDTGCGLPPDAERIFEPFYTTKQHGLGLGLAICRSIITVHHGRFWAEPGVLAGSGSTTGTPGGGATFHVELPVAAGGKT